MHVFLRLLLLLLLVVVMVKFEQDELSWAAAAACASVECEYLGDFVAILDFGAKSAPRLFASRIGTGPS